ncbi:inositol-3-phosphate synthase [Agromyces ramosus]|uniref:Myo-inositol-1-phosphate synthase n=1 Tax=Agromyces ramosus TaxID=33879 RepID=A0ABU0R820_9MICO|nr:inositol-3-phosphate synthase [Agromyces ramosus]MDQ0894231.1 myo-inositol-1-phosphate synthase [Agromyces ramosus]
MTATPWRNHVTMLDTASTFNEPTLDTAASTNPASTGWAHGRVGVWLIGARGSVATAVAVGLNALATGLAAPIGCATAGPEFAGVPLPGYGDFVLGGHDVSTTPLPRRAQMLADTGMIPQAYVTGALAALERADAEIRPGYDPATNTGSQAEAARRLADDITAFRDRNGLDRVVVIDVSSTEPLIGDRPEFHDAEQLSAAIEETESQLLPASSIAALAAIHSGSAYTCFTPSTGLALPALVELADRRGIPFGGQDGKTGETLIRTALAPMFGARGMHVHSWAGANLLGGGDGATLADPEAVQSKLVSKTRGLRSLVGEHVVAPLHIDNVPDLGDIKTAWDHIHAEGFLGTRITLQTTWSAYDSMLAAPLVLDLARLLGLADAAGARGVVPELGFFFKDPWGSDVHDFGRQTAALIEWAQATGARLSAEARSVGTAR